MDAASQNRLDELRRKHRAVLVEEYPSSVPVADYERNHPRRYSVGDEVLVRCKVVGPALLAYGEDCLILDLVQLDSRNDETGGRFTASPKDVMLWSDLMPTAS